MGFVGIQRCPICNAELKDLYFTKYCPFDCDRLGARMGSAWWGFQEWQVFRANPKDLKDDDRVYWWHVDYGYEKPSVITTWNCEGETEGPGVRWGGKNGKLSLLHEGYDLDEFYYVRFIK